MRRLYFLAPDTTTAQAIVDDLLRARITWRHIHVLANHSVGLERLPEASLLQRSDVVHALERGVALSPTDAESDDVDLINDAFRPLIHAIAPREVAEAALRVAEETDRRIESLPPERMWPMDAGSPLNAVRADHRGEHLDEIEAALNRR